MDASQAKERISWLRSEIERHNRKYYVDSNPEISDREFDSLLLELSQLEQQFPQFLDPSSPTQRVGSDLSGGFAHVQHERPMLSLSNTYSPQEVDEWFDRVSRGLGGEDFQIVGELKFDGVSISLKYKGGRLVQAVTRGDGSRGDDVTANVRTIASIPKILPDGDWPDEFEIRGEILMPWDVFEALNEERAYNEEPLFANPRNAASGSLKMQNPAEVARRRLDSRLYFMLGDTLPADNHYDNLLAAARWGFKVSPEMTLLRSREDVDAFISRWETERKTLPVATDGLVFKVNSLRQQQNLGFTAKSPRWAIAYKFNPERACTPLRFVSFETGRMGVITPVANLEPVLLSGTVVKRASLHNEDIMRQLDIHEHDSLYVEKGGEIIPKITGVEMADRKPGAKPVEFVTHCPVCGTPLVRVEGEAAWRCPNQYGCRPQITGKIEHFAARRMMNIDGIGEETAELLYAAGLVRRVGDLYRLRTEDLERLEGMGERTAAKIVKGIGDTRLVPFERVLYSLSIPNVGETTAKQVARAAGSMDALMAMTVDQLKAIPDVGPTIAQGIYDCLRDPVCQANIEDMRQAGVQMEMPQRQAAGDELAGMTIVISGTFAHHSRDEYKRMIEDHGGKNSGSISSKTTFVLAGDNMGPAKLEKCRKLGIGIKGEDDFLALLSR